MINDKTDGQTLPNVYFLNTMNSLLIMIFYTRSISTNSSLADELKLMHSDQLGQCLLPAQESCEMDSLPGDMGEVYGKHVILLHFL